MIFIVHFFLNNTSPKPNSARGNFCVATSSTRKSNLGLPAGSAATKGGSVPHPNVRRGQSGPHRLTFRTLLCPRSSPSFFPPITRS